MPKPNYAIVGDVITQARNEASIGSNPIAAALQQSGLMSRLRDLDGEGVAYPQSVGFLGWWFNDREQIIEAKAPTTLLSAASSGASSLTLTSGVGWDSPSADLGAGYLKNGSEIFDYFTFEGRASGALSVVDGLQVDHVALEEARKLYKLNDNFGWARALFRQSRNLTYRQMSQSLRQVPAEGTYTVKYLESTNYNGLFLVLPENVTALQWKLMYQKASVQTVTDLTDVLSLPGQSHGFRYYVEGLKEYIFDNEGEEQDAAKSAAKKFAHLEKLLDEFGIEDQSGENNILVPDA